MGLPTGRFGRPRCHQARHVVVEPAALPLSPACCRSATRGVVQPTMALTAFWLGPLCHHLGFGAIVEPNMSSLYRSRRRRTHRRQACCVVLGLFASLSSAHSSLLGPRVVVALFVSSSIPPCRVVVLGLSAYSSTPCRAWLSASSSSPPCRACAVRCWAYVSWLRCLFASSSTPPCRGCAVLVVEPTVS